MPFKNIIKISVPRTPASKKKKTPETRAESDVSSKRRSRRRGRVAQKHDD